jgi:hypothetical protein
MLQQVCQAQWQRLLYFQSQLQESETFQQEALNSYARLHRIMMRRWRETCTTFLVQRQQCPLWGIDDIGRYRCTGNAFPAAQSGGQCKQYITSDQQVRQPGIPTVPFREMRKMWLCQQA